MATNPWLSQREIMTSERELYQDLIDESIAIKGIDIRYLKRELVNEDYLLGEAPISNFKEAILIEMFMHDIRQFNGNGDLFASLGMVMTDEVTFEVSVRRFEQEGKSIDMNRPREGDLIYLLESDALFEITKVKNDDEFYKLGRNFKYQLDCKLFTYSYEGFEDHTPEANIRDFHVNEERISELESILGIKDERKDQSKGLDEDMESNISVDFDQDDPFNEGRYV